MIKIFRKIRQKMLTENKFSKYLIYAIGEIFLVVIGILIALSINNWNDERKEKIEANKEHNNINKEFRNNLKNLDNTLKIIDELSSSLSLLMQTMNEPSSNKFKKEKLDTLLMYCSSIPPKWNRSDMNVRGIENTNKIGEIKNEELKQLLYEWFEINESIKYLEKNADEAFSTYVNYIKENGSWREIDKLGNNKNLICGGSILMPDNDHLILDYKFENIVDDHLVWLLNKKQGYNDARRQVQKIIEESEK